MLSNWNKTSIRDDSQDWPRMRRPHHRAVGRRESKTRSCIVMSYCFFCCWESAEEGHLEVDVSGSLASKFSMEYEPDERGGLDRSIKQF